MNVGDVTAHNTPLQDNQALVMSLDTEGVPHFFFFPLLVTSFFKDVSPPMISLVNVKVSKERWDSDSVIKNTNFNERVLLCRPGKQRTLSVHF